MRPTRVLVADGSTTRRERLVALLRADPALAIVGEAASGADTLALTRQLRPDIVAIDLRLSGQRDLDPTPEIMAEVPTPILIVADEAESQLASVLMSALRSGALAVVARPRDGQDPDGSSRFVSTLKAMSQVRVVRRWRERAPREPERRLTLRRGGPARIVAVAASTGGPAALHQMLTGLPETFSLPILVVQHIGIGFTAGMASWLNTASALNVKVAVHGEPLSPRTVYVAADDRHLGVADTSTILLSRADPIGGFRPSATFLFQSVASVFGPSALHVILTGMGQDGVAGLKVAHELGGTIIAQDPKSSVVSSMPSEAINAGLVDHVASLAALAHDLAAITQN